MFKKYGIFVFFSFLFMLCGITLLSVLNAKLPYSIIEEVEQEEPSNAAASLDITLNIDNVYGMGGSSSSGATISGYVGLHRDNGETANSKYFSIGTSPGTETVISTKSQALNYYRYVRIDSVSISSAGKDGSSTLRTTETQVTSTDSQGGSNGPAVITGYYDDCRLSSLSGGARFRMNIYWSIYYSCNTNGGSGGNSSFIYDTYNKRMIVSGSTVSQISTPSRTGYKFKGYYTETSGGTQVIDANGRFLLNRSSAKPEQLYAQWTANKYTVSYSLGGGTEGTYHPTSWTYNTPQRISNPTRTGHAFTGWTASNLSTSTAVYGTSSNTTTRWSNANTKVKASSATGALYFKNLRTTSGIITLTANWTPIEYTLTYNPNGGSVSPPSKKVFYNSAYGDLPTPTKKGYSFTGWYTSPTGGSKVSTTTKMGAADTTIYAHWTVNTYAVTFDDQGGTTNFADMVLIDSTYKTNGTYTFTRNGVTVTYDVSDSALTLNGTPTNDINLFINLGLSFTQNDVYKVSYQKISGSMSGNTTGCFVLEVCASDWANLATRNRVDFHMNNSSGSANLTISSSGATNGAGLKLWFWCNETGTPSRVFNNFKVKFKIEKSGTQNVQKQTMFTYGSALEAVAPPTRVGYNFQGYYTQTGGGGTRYFDSSGHPVVSTMNIANNTTTLHAYWTAKTNCVLSFDAKGGTVSPTSRNQTFNASLGTLPIPTRTGYIFTGWYTSASAGNEVTSLTIMKSESMTIYALWAETWANHVEEPKNTETVGNVTYTLIEKEEQLAWLINNGNTKKYLLTNHIDMSDYYWLPIGTETRPFGGVFDGQGYTIKGLHTISQSERRDNGGDNSGFIGVASGATIKNIYFDDIQINGKNHVGAVIGYVIGSNKTNVSGIAVRNYGTKSGERLVEATGAKGLIVGYSKISQKAVVRDCLGVQETNCGTYFQIASVDCKDSIGYIWNGSSYSMSKSAASSVGFANWVSVTGLPFQLPKGLAWIAEGKY